MQRGWESPKHTNSMHVLYNIFEAGCKATTTPCVIVYGISRCGKPFVASATSYWQMVPKKQQRAVAKIRGIGANSMCGKELLASSWVT